MLPLDKSRDKNGSIIEWTKSLPYIKNNRGKLIHRPRYVRIYKTGKGYHMAVTMHCGSIQCGSNKFKFTNNVSQCDVICLKCEENAVSSGLPTSYYLNNDSILIGGIDLLR